MNDLLNILQENKELSQYVASVNANPYIARNALGMNTGEAFMAPLMVVQSKQTLMAIEGMSQQLTKANETNEKLVAIIEKLSGVIETHLKEQSKAQTSKKK